jgi:hypothetical protein
MEILKIYTTEGYRLEVPCEFDECHWVGQLDAQQPIWAAFVELEGHITMKHRVDATSIQVVNRKQRRIENVELPLDLGNLELPHDGD